LLDVGVVAWDWDFIALLSSCSLLVCLLDVGVVAWDWDFIALFVATVAVL
jgi:hypothetical protein